MKSLRIFVLAGICFVSTATVAFSDEGSETAKPTNVSATPLDQIADEPHDSDKTDPLSQEESPLPPEEKESLPEDPETQPGLVQEERWVLGIQCDAADPLLRKHLKLGSTGLVVLQVKAETPAAECDLRPDDLITHIDETELTCRDDLIRAVTGSNGATLSLAIVREGVSQKIQITPRRMLVPVMMSPAMSRPDAGDKDLEGNATAEGKIFQGVLIQGTFPFDEGSLEEIDVRALVQQLREMTAKDDKQGPHDSSRIVITIPDSESAEYLTAETLHKNIAALKDHVRALQKRIEKMESRLKELKDPKPGAP